MAQPTDVTVAMISGPAATGKSTLAEALASRFSMRCLDLDLFYTAFREVVPKEIAPPGLHQEDEVFWAQPVDVLVAHYVQLQEYMCSALESVVSNHVVKGKSLVIEGAWILPSFASRRMYGGVKADVRGLFLIEPDPLEMERRRLQRAYPWHRTFSEDVMRNLVAMRHEHGQEMKRRAEALHLPVLESRPFETLEARAIEALDLNL